MKEEVNNTSFLLKILMIFLILQPLLDTSFLYSDKVISIFHFSPTTIIRFVFVFFLLGIVFFSKSEKKDKKVFFVYSLLLLFYTGGHIIFCKNFNVNNYDTFSFSLITELMYLLRVFLPISVIYLFYILNPSKKQFLSMITNLSFVLSLLMVVTNLLKVAYLSYGEGVVQGSILNWFVNSQNYSSDLLASKAFFNSANQISGLMMLILPILTINLFENFSIKNLIAEILFILSMIMIGTRTATFGWVLCIVMVVIVYLFLVVIKKKSFNFLSFLGILSILGLGILVTVFYGPLVSIDRQDVFVVENEKAEKNVQEIAETIEIINGDDVTLEEKEEIIKQVDCFDEDKEIKIDCLVDLLPINSIFYKKVYPVSNHEDFWKYFMFDISSEKRYGQRNVQMLINKDVVKNNKNNRAILWGYGYSRYINAYLYPEHDFYIQYYTIGILGLLLFVFPYIFIILFSLIKNFIKKRFDFLEIVLCGTIFEVLLISVLTGHIIDELIVSLFLGTISGYLLLSVNKKNKLI